MLELFIIYFDTALIDAVDLLSPTHLRYVTNSDIASSEAILEDDNLVDIT